MARVVNVLDALPLRCGASIKSSVSVRPSVLIQHLDKQAYSKDFHELKYCRKI